MKEPDLRTKEERQLAAIESIARTMKDIVEMLYAIARELREKR